MSLLRDRGRRVLVLVFLLTLPLVTTRLRGADEIEYFAYLRSAVFDQDLDFGNEYEHFHALDPHGLAGFKATFLDRREPTTGRHINFAPAGSALLWSPFYLLAHAGVLTARALGASVAADGFSRPYVAAVCYASAAYGFAGLLLIHAALRRFALVTEPVAVLTTLGVWLATPLLYYMSLAPGFSHATSVFVVSLLLFLWLRARERDGGSVFDWAVIGAVTGVAGMVREQDVLYAAAPGLWLLWHAVDRKRIVPGVVRLAAMGAAALLAFVPQLLAYHAVNGRYGPSRLVTRKMSWHSPHFFEVMLDPGHGLFLWAPLLLVATVGLLVLLLRRRDPVAPLLAVALLLQVWINGAVESWSQAGAFGSRRFVSASFVFAWGLTAVLAAMQARLGRPATAALTAAFVGWNLGLMLQFGLKLMDRQRLEWPRVAVNQVTAVPPRLARTAWLFFTDRERLVREGR